MTNRYLSFVLPLATALMAVGCVDDKYDLGNIDSSVEVPVNDLVIPVNFNPVTLNSIIDLDGSITSEKTPDGKDIYVYSYSGDFGKGSKDIRINDFTVNPPTGIRPSVVHVDLLDQNNARKKAPTIPGFTTVLTYKMNNMKTDFTYEINDVDSKVASIDRVLTTNVVFSIKLTMPEDIKKICDKIELQNVKMIFPKGLYLKSGQSAKSSIGQYNAESGELIINNYTTQNGEVELNLTAEMIDLKKLGLVLENNNIDFKNSIVVDSGNVNLTFKIESLNFPTEFDVDIAYGFSSFKVTNFSGKINYDIDAPEFKPADLSDIPDFLAQGDTKIKIANPQIYISIDNTCAPYGLGGSAGIEITQIRDGVTGRTLKMEDQIVIGHDNGVGPYKFAISPQGQNLNVVPEYAGAKKYLFSTLGEVLYGDGIPQQLDVNFINPKIEGEANNFPLGVNIPSVTGDYLFRAPLALAEGSQIIYSGTEDNWNIEALEDLQVNNLELTATITSSVPLAVKLSAKILNKEGRHIGNAVATEIPAMADNFPVTITISPEGNNEYISDIDGVFYEAWAISTTPADQTEALSPDQTLKLDNIRVKVSGKYVHLDDGK